MLQRTSRRTRGRLGRTPYMDYARGLWLFRHEAALVW